MKKTLLIVFINLLMLFSLIKVQAQALSSSPTLSFSNMTGFGDNIAQDGEGGSVAISDINIQVMPINSSGTKLTLDPLEYHDQIDWGTPAIITYGGSNPFFGWSIRSDNGSDFSLISFDFNNWGDWSGAQFTVQAFHNGSSLGTVDFAGNTDNSMIHVTNTGILTSIFQNVDEVRVYQKGGGVDSWTGLNNIKVSSPSSALPVTWLNFAASYQSTGVVLNWSTTTEQNTKDYVVQHSSDGRNWSNIATIAAAGNSSTVQQYTYVHSNILSGVHYYRVLQNDMDGRESYSKMLVVDFLNAQKSLHVYPNPVVNSQLTVKLEKKAGIQLFNAAGILVFQGQLYPGIHQLQLPNLEKGLFIIKAGEETENIIVQ
jgi:hypothetical protein